MQTIPARTAPGLIPITPTQAGRIAGEIEGVTRSRGGVDRVDVDESRLRFDPVNPELDTALGRYAEVLGPRYVDMERTPKSATDGQIDLREGVTAPGDGVKWKLKFVSGETGEPLANGQVGAWMTAPSGYRGKPDAQYHPDAFRGWTQLDEQGTVTITAHDPEPYEYPLGSGNILSPHIHGYLKGVDGHVEMPFEQLRTKAVPLDTDAKEFTIVVPPGEGRMVLGAWDAHPSAQHAPDTLADGRPHPDAGFVLPSEPQPLD